MARSAPPAPVDVAARAAAARGPDLPYEVADPGHPPALVTESGLPDPATFPAAALGHHLDRVLREETDRLQYGTLVDGELLYGPVELRRLLAARTATAGAPLDERSVLLTAGAGHAISLAVRAFVDPGDVVAVECPSWDYIQRDLAMAGADVVSVPLDGGGIVVEALEEALAGLEARGRRLRMLYTIPTFNVPTGAVATVERRRRLVELAATHGFLILEDDVYAALRYAGDPVPTLQSLDGAGCVVRVDSFSKTIAPGLRLGWASGSPEAMAALASVRRDLGVSHLMARAVAGLVADGTYDAHVAEVCAVYRAKRDLAVDALHTHGQGLVSCRPPDGGYFLWLALDATVDGDRVHREAAARGVVCRPGHRFFPDPADGAGRLRLSFTEPSAGQMVAAATILGEAAVAARRSPVSGGPR